MAQITNVTSESLQARMRSLLPSQQGFGEDLQASNVILPVIDLTDTAEGSSLPSYLQTALTFTDATTFEVNNTTTQIINTAGFWQINSTITTRGGTSGNSAGAIRLSDGSSTKDVISLKTDSVSSGSLTANVVNVVVCLSAGETISIFSNNLNCFVSGSARQVATLDGTLVNPTGYAPQ